MCMSFSVCPALKPKDFAPTSAVKIREPVPQVLKQVVNLSCFGLVVLIVKNLTNDNSKWRARK